MKDRLILPSLLLALCCVSAAVAQDTVVQKNPIVVQARHAETSLAFRDLADVGWHNISKVMPEHDRSLNPHISGQRDTVAQTEILAPVSANTILNFDGINDSQAGGFVPPDTNASVGTTQVVETVNVAFAVYNKSTGAQIMAPKSVQTLYTPLGGQCATGNLSDPVVNFDKVAQRWVITMIAFNGNFSVNDACMAVSTSADATGTYHVYAFAYGKTLPDYPKVGVWPDAYYVTTDSFPNGGFFTGAESCAMDRTAMLAGNTAKMVCFQRGSGDFALVPADVDGATQPAAGAPNFQMDLASSTQLNLYKFHVDFGTTSNSTFTGPTKLTVAAYTDACSACIKQPSPGESLDSLGDRLMYRLAYRNFGDHEAMVVSHSVKGTGTGNAPSAVRWYEVRNPNSTPVLFQQGTFGGGSLAAALWMGSIAMDKVGDIALGASASSATLKPSILFTGRVPTDALGKMESGKLIIQGTGVQQNSFNRWGDYSSMAIDPVDDCTFWYAQEYYKTNSSFNFATRLASLKFTTCH